MLSPAEAARRGRLGGFSTAARYDSRAQNAKARRVYRDSFESGHGCHLCPRIDIDPSLPPEERRRRAEALRRLHFSWLGLASGKARRT